MQHGPGRTLVVLAAFLTALTHQARTEIATFDDVDADPAEFAAQFPETYKELRWSGMLVVNSAHESLARYPKCGYRTGLVSGLSVAVVTSRYGTPAEIVSVSGLPFDFTGVHLTAGWKDDLTVHLEGLRKGLQVHSTVVEVDTAQATPFSFEFLSIDTLRIRTSGGVDAGICDADCRPGPEAVLDDFTFTFAAAAPALRQEKLSPPATVKSAAPRGRVPVKLVEKRPTWMNEPKPPPAAESASVEPPPASVSTPAEPPAEKPDVPETRQRSCHGIQVGAFRSSEGASRMIDELSGKYDVTPTVVQGNNRGPVYRVVIGCEDNRQEAVALLKKVHAMGVEGFVVQVFEPEQKESQ